MGIVKIGRPGRVSALESRLLRYEIPTMTSHLPSLGLDFLVCKMGIIIVPSPKGILRIKLVNSFIQ